MKTLIAALTVLTLVAGQASAAQAIPRHARGNAAAAEQSGTYHGYPLSDWYRTDTW
jgi:opacity protein-like surface antigen